MSHVTLEDAFMHNHGGRFPNIIFRESNAKQKLHQISLNIYKKYATNLMNTALLFLFAKEMDKDEICFFNLIELIEEYGYTSKRWFEPTNSAENKNKGSSMMKIKVALSLNVIQIKEQYYNEQTQGTNGTVLTHVWDLPKDKRILHGTVKDKEGYHVIDLLMRLEKIQVNIEKEVIYFVQMILMKTSGNPYSISLNLLQHIQGYCFFLETR
ncbi:hypothetical protein ACJX0J_012930 [Zea mays]